MIELQTIILNHGIEMVEHEFYDRYRVEFFHASEVKVLEISMATQKRAYEVALIALREMIKHE